jgi:hydrogenase expression/formation protein HypE
MDIAVGPNCPLPLAHTDRIVMGHGSGGRMTHELIARHFMPALDNPLLRLGDDAAAVELPSKARLAVSTDAHVVAPLFFPGGDIGRLAVCGTVNDVSMLGARPLYLTASFILEEGLEISVLQRVLESMRLAAQEAGVQVIAGDTKVVQRGKADGLYISTTGVGLIETSMLIGGAQAKPGDAVLISGPLGDHGIAVLAARGELGFETTVQSDAAPLNHLVAALLAGGITIHVLRDPTRGGLATSLNEIATQSQVGVTLEEPLIPVRPEVNAACELLGFDPLYIANEGRLIVILPAEFTDQALAAMRSAPYGAESCQVGTVSAEPVGRVVLHTALGSTRIVDRLAGEMLPRIC